MKKRLNDQLSVQSALLIVVSAVLLILISATVAKACGPFSEIGCDINCTVQVINNCKYAGFDRVARTCQYCSGCNPRCASCVQRICAACVDHSLGCAAAYLNAVHQVKNQQQREKNETK